MTVGGKEREQTKITWKEEQMVVVSDLEGNKISLTGNIQFGSGSENVYEVLDCLAPTKLKNLSL